jgi:uncharacterized membrane protein YjjP (DUF1212 family)
LLGLANGPPGAHSQAMVYILSKIVDLLFSVFVASMIAGWLGLAAHYLGLSRLDIRTSALMGAGIIALVLALLIAIEWLAGPRKSK